MAAMSTFPEISPGAACMATIAPPAGSACINEARAVHQHAGVVEGEHPGDMRGGDLPDGVPGQMTGPHAERLQQPEQRHLEREDRGLRDPRLPEPHPGRHGIAHIDEARHPHQRNSALSDVSPTAVRRARTRSNASANAGNAS